MPKKINKKRVLLFSIILLSLITILSIKVDKKNNIINKIINKEKVTDPTEIELDNWEISTVFYDSKVDNGTTPLTEINWDASEIPLEETEERVITVQINYKNTNTVTSYAPGELEISIPNLTYHGDQVYTVKNFGVNDSSHTGYDWDLASTANAEILKFTNSNTIETHTNLEGSIQLDYTITSKAEVDYIPYNGSLTEAQIERDEDECTHSFNQDLIAKINNEIESNQLSFSYKRTYTHPWQHYEYTLTKTGQKISSYDRLGENPEDYTWVKYKFTWNHYLQVYHSVQSFFQAIYPLRYVPSDSFKLIDDGIPDDCVVYDFYGNKVEKENGVYTFTNLINTDHNRYQEYYYRTDYFIYVGYPKSIYNEENNNMVINNHVTLKGTYYKETEEQELAEATSSINLADFDFTYTGNLYSFSKTNANSSNYKLDYEGVVGLDDALDDTNTFYIYENVKYTGEKYDVIIGDDALFITDENNEFRRLEDDEYSFERIVFNYNFKNSNDQIIDLSKYDSEFWVRYAGEDDYEFYKEIKGTYFEEYNFSRLDKKVVGFYIIVKDLEEGINVDKLHINISINNSDVNRTHENTGKIYNAGYLKVLINGELVNAGTEENYSTEALTLLRDYDLNTHGSLLQRSAASCEYAPFNPPTPKNYVSVKKEMPNPIQNEEKKDFEGTATLKLAIGGSGTASNYCDTYTGRNCIQNYFINRNIDPNSIEGWNIYDLLPVGMKLESTKEEIKESIVNKWTTQWTNSTDDPVYSIDDGEYISRAEFFQRIKDHTEVTIINNYKGTNRTLIKISMNLEKKYFIFEIESFIDLVSFTYNYSIDYDAYIDNGSVWNNNAYSDYVNHEANNSSYEAGNGKTFIINSTNYTRKDDGSLDSDEADINNNNNTNEYIGWAKSSITISSVVSTHQDVQTSVQSDLSNFSIGKVNVSKDGEYIYKLRARTGASEVTNLVIYDSIEDYAKNPDLEIIKASNGKPSWQGTLLSIDTSHAEEQGYTVKVYYNENSNPGSLSDDNSWQEYTDSTDKSKVKAVAFKYLNAEGTAAAVLPANSNTYVLLKMKAPNEDLTYFTYNGCWTEWNAIDSVTGRPVDFITGINSNIVKVALPSSVELIDMDVTLTKVWKDNSNALNTRPSTINYKLIPNGDETNAITVPLTGTDNTWSTTVSIPKYNEYGVLIYYTIEEEVNSLNNNYKYVSELTDTYEYTNTLYKDITLTKIWKDNTDAYLTRPTSVTYIVKQNGNDYQTITFNGELTTNEWTKTISVPVYDNNNNEYNYTIEEVEIDNYSSSCSEFTCTNTLTGTNEFKIKKVWNDSNNEYSTRPSSIDIKLNRNGNVINTYTLTGTGNTWESDNIISSKYDENGVKYTYTISETPLDEYGLVEYNQANYQVTNTLKKNINITITKKWVDNSNALGLRPNELKINLLRNNSQYQELTLTGTGNTWTTTIEVPKYDDNEHLYTYSIKELSDSLNKDYSNITYSEEELTVTNKLEKKTSIKISKIWDDGDNELLTRPENLTINLLRNGSQYRELTLTPESINDNTWELDVNNLDVYDNNGAKYTYTIEENLIDQLDRYETITYDQTNYTITNKLTIPPKVTLFFTVKNGYLKPGSDELQYDEEGLNDILSTHNLNAEDEYIFNFELENVDTGEIIKGVLSTQGTLEFDDIPYGTYRARESEDKYFDFVSMIEIEAVLGVSFTPDSRGGTITISPTGYDIVYGANITNKIEKALDNPNTFTHKSYLLINLFVLTISIITGLYFYKKNALIK